MRTKMVIIVAVVLAVVALGVAIVRTTDVMNRIDERTE